MKEQANLQVDPLYPILTYWIRPLAVNIGKCMFANCTNDAAFMLFGYEDRFNAANLITTAQLSEQEAEKLLWEKSAREQTEGILKEYAHIPCCTQHLSKVMQIFVGEQAILTYIMPSLMFGTQLIGDAVIFRFKRDSDVFNLLQLPGNCKTVEELLHYTIQGTPKNI